jgi:hypothetical protein
MVIQNKIMDIKKKDMMLIIEDKDQSLFINNKLVIMLKIIVSIMN